MEPQGRLANRKTVYREMVIGVEKTTEDFIRDLFILKNVRIKGVKQKLQDAERKYKVPIHHNVPNLRVKGWQGKPKGLLQVLWDRGFIDL